MQLNKLLEKWDLTSLKIKTPFLEAHWEPKDEDKDAAWDLYIALLPRRRRLAAAVLLHHRSIEHAPGEAEHQLVRAPIR